MRSRWPRGRCRAVAGILGLGLVIAACSITSPVAVERSDRSQGELTADSGPGMPDVGAERSPTPSSDGDQSSNDGDAEIVDAPATSLAWDGCLDVDIPDPDILGTAGWECAMLSVPMDPFAADAGADAEQVELALTRHPATGGRRGAILVNPGGPGGSGLETVWALRNDLPTALLRGFDLVSWDPRGVGESSPRIDCDDEVPPGEADFIARCVELTGPLSAFLAAPYSVADMEAIRVALGEQQLNYLGYSYGTVLGATYAADLPDRVGAFVLDGATDPNIGSDDGPSDDGFPSLADDGFAAAQARFEELCDASDRCLFSLDAGEVIEALAAQVGVLPTPDFDRDPDRVTTDAYLDVIDNALTFAGDWELLATALADADRGDASALAALSAGPDGTGDLDGEPDAESDDGPGESDFAEANFMIYCADFAPLLDPQTFCDAMPSNAERVQSVRPVEVQRELLVIGTEFDPLTPGYHAPEFAAALGDATHIIWEGVGHTAFPGWTPCIDDAVEAQFLGDPLPTAGTSCSFLFDVDDDETLGDELFGQGDIESEFMLEGRLAPEVGDVAAACLATQLNLESDQVISHVILDVTSDAATEALATAASSC